MAGNSDISAAEDEFKRIKGAMGERESFTFWVAVRMGGRWADGVRLVAKNAEAIAALAPLTNDAPAAPPTAALRTPTTAAASAEASFSAKPSKRKVKSGAGTPSKGHGGSPIHTTGSAAAAGGATISGASTCTFPLGSNKRTSAVPETPSKKKTSSPPSPAAATTSASPSSSHRNKRVPVVPQTPSKKRKTTPSFGAEPPKFTTPAAPSTGKRRLSAVDEEDLQKRIVNTVKRIKKMHRAGSERPVAGKKRGYDESEEFAVYREGVGMKRPRMGYFQEGDPPIEYETWSDEDDEGEEKKEEVEDDANEDDEDHELEEEVEMEL